MEYMQESARRSEYITIISREIWGPHDGDNGDYFRLRCDTV
jgi:hypothetical protein